jgi:hypothetical protein
MELADVPGETNEVGIQTAGFADVLIAEWECGCVVECWMSPCSTLYCVTLKC